MTDFKNSPKPLEEYKEDNNKILVFDTKWEDIIFNYYDSSKWWKKHKTDDYFLLIKEIKKKKIIKKGLTNEEKKIKEDIRLMYDYNLPVKEARKVEYLLNQLNFDSLFDELR